MAYLNFKADDEEDKPQQGEAYQQAYGLGGAGGGGVAAPQQQAAQAAPGASGEYTNFDKYFAANKDASDRTATAMGQGVRGQAEKAKTGLAKLTDDFGHQLYSGTPRGPAAPTVVDRGARPTSAAPYANTSAAGQPESTTEIGTQNSAQPAPYVPPDFHQATSTKTTVKTPAETVADESDDDTFNDDGTLNTDNRNRGKGRPKTKAAPGSYVSTTTSTPANMPTPEEVAAAQAGAAATYSGPSGFDTLKDYAGVAGDTRAAEEQVKQLGTNEGRQALLQKDNRQGVYNDAQSAFDAGLAGVSGRPEFNAIRGQYKGLGQGLTDATAAGNARVGVAKAGAQKSQDDWKSWLAAYDKANNVQPAVEPGDSGVAPTSRKPSWAEMYDQNGWNDAYGVIKNAASFLDPINMVGYPAGGKLEVWNSTDDLWRGLTGSEANGNSQMTEEVWNSMSDEEYDAYMAMNYRSRMAWAAKRWDELQARKAYRGEKT